MCLNVHTYIKPICIYIYHIYIYMHTYRQTYRHTDKQIDRPAGRQASRQTDIITYLCVGHTYVYTYMLVVNYVAYLSQSLRYVYVHVYMRMCVYVRAYTCIRQSCHLCALLPAGPASFRTRCDNSAAA